MWFFLIFLLPSLLLAEVAPDTKVDPELKEALDSEAEAEKPEVRFFHEVLNSLLTEFSYDVKMGQIKGLKNLAINRVEVSAALPETYSEYLELLVKERIHDYSKVRVVHCLPCTTRTSKLVEGKLMITSPSTDVRELRRAAQQLGIENFMDVILVYHTTHMVLAFQIFRADSNELIWSRSYNSETVRSRYQRLAVDYSQVAESRAGDEYSAEYRILLGLGGAGIPNIAGTALNSTMLDVQIRATEKFNHRRDEFGMQLNIYTSLALVLSEYPVLNAKEVEEPTTTEATPLPFNFAFQLSGMYVRNFIQKVEFYSDIRQGVNVGLGALIALGYIAPVARLGGDLYFGRNLAMSIAGMYILPSQILVATEAVPTAGGIGGELVFSYNF